MEEIDKQDIQSLRNGMNDDNVESIFKKYSKEGKMKESTTCSFFELLGKEVYQTQVSKQNITETNFL